MIGKTFTMNHAAGVTRFEVVRRHERHTGYFVCKAFEAISGTHHFLKSENVFGREYIEQKLHQAERDAGLIEVLKKYEQVS